MPRGDRTGPMGAGPMTGRGAGYCAGYPVPGYANPILRYGAPFGRGCFGGGHGWRHWYYATGLPRWARPGFPAAGVPAPVYPAPSAEMELAGLKNEATWLKEQLEAIHKRIAELEKEKEA